MSAQYSRDLIRVSVGKMLQTVGWHSIQTGSLEILTDVIIHYIKQIGKLTNGYANVFGRTEPNLDHLGLAFHDFLVNLPELKEYITYMDFAQSPTSAPKYPVIKEHHSDFLKHDSQECVYTHEHLPSKCAVQKASEVLNELTIKQDNIENIAANGSTTKVTKQALEITAGEFFERSLLLIKQFYL